jgi:hypothetical protein
MVGAGRRIFSIALQRCMFFAAMRMIQSTIKELQRGSGN